MFHYSKYDVGQKVIAKTFDYHVIVSGLIVGVAYYRNNSPVFKIKTDTGKIKEICNEWIIKEI